MPGALHTKGSSEPHFQCYGPVLVTEDLSQLHQNTTDLIRSLFSKEEEWPRAVVVEWDVFSYSNSKDIGSAAPLDHSESIGELAEMVGRGIPPQWDGQVIAVASRSLIPPTSPSWSPMSAPPLPEDIDAQLSEAFRRPVQALDMVELVVPMARSHEFGVRGASPYWHQVTNDLGHHSGAKPHVQGLITEMLATMVYHASFGPRISLSISSPPKSVRDTMPPYNASGTRRRRQHGHRRPLPKLHVCHDCPSTTTRPYALTTKPTPDLQCHQHLSVHPAGKPASSSSPHPASCPAWCLASSSSAEVLLRLATESSKPYYQNLPVHICPRITMA